MPISAPGPAMVAPHPIQHDAGVPPPHTPAEVASPPPADDGRVQNEPLRLHGQSGHLSLLRDAPDGWHHGAQPAIAHKPHAQLDGPPGHGSAHQPAAPIGAAPEFRLSDMNLAPGIAQQARIGPLQRDIATAFRPEPIGGALSGLMGSSITGPGAAAAGPLGSNPVSGQLLPAGGVLVQLKSQAPADPAAPQPTPPTTATPEAAAPQGAEPVAPAAPSADPAEIGALELVLADPANQEMIRHFGGELKPLPTWTSVGKGIEARYGADLAGRLYQLQTAQRAVEDEFFEAMDQARRNSPKSTPHYFPRRGDPLPTADQPGWVYKPGDGHWDGNGPSWEFDPGVFARHYAQGDTPAQRAFAHLHGPDPVQFIPAPDTETGGSAEWVLSGVTLREGRRLSFDEGLTPDSVVAKDGWAPSRLLRGEHFLDPDRITKLNNKEFVWFDPVHGFSTDPDNIKGDWLDRAFPYLFSAAFTAMTFGAGAGVGAAAVAGSAGTGASMGLGATISAAVGGGTAGTIAVGAATGAVSSATLQLAANGKINFGQVLQSALAGGATAGISKIPRIGEFLDGKAPSFGQRLMEHTGRATVQGAIQSVMGGKFRDGMVNSLIGSLAGEVTAQIDAQIDGIRGLDPSQAGALRLLSRATGSALRLAGSNDPAAGFASDFLGGLMQDALIPNSPQTAGAEAGDAPAEPTDPLGQFIDDNQARWDTAGPAAPSTVTVAQGDTLERIARQHYGADWRAGITLMMADNQLGLNRWGSPVIRAGDTLHIAPLDGLNNQQLGQLSRMGGQILANNTQGLNVRTQIDAMRAQQRLAQQAAIAPRAPGTMTPDEAHALYMSTGGRSGSYARAMGEAYQPTWHQGGEATDGTASNEPSLGQRMNAEAASWSRVIDRLDDAAVADGGGLITAGAALARAPARSFLGFVQGAVGAASLADPVVRTQLYEGLRGILADPGVIPAAVGRYYDTHTIGEIAADAYVGASGALMGSGAGSSALGRLNAVVRPNKPVWVWGPDVPHRMGQSGAINLNGHWIDTVTEAQRLAFRDNGYLDPFTNRIAAAPSNRPIQVDHIFPVSEIIKLPGFRDLTREQMGAILQDRIGIGNLQPLPSYLNASKGPRVGGDWSAYRGRALNQDYIDNIDYLQRSVREQILRHIELFRQADKVGGK